MSKQANKSVSKKGIVINRRNNRTIDRSVARGNDRLNAKTWEDLGRGILRLRGPESHTAYITLRAGKFVSLTRKEVEVLLAPKEAPEEKKAA